MTFGLFIIQKYQIMESILFILVHESRGPL